MAYQMGNTGITYYKLISDYQNRGDYPPKNCGLTATEVDQNFYFLRGNDIDGFIKDEESKKVSLQRMNGDKIEIPMFYDFDYDAGRGTLTITAPNGTFIEVPGFYCESKDKRIYSDNTLIGEGTKESPLGLSGLERTGTYAACKDVIDFTKGETLPVDPKFGDRYVTKEKVNAVGVLYNFEGVKEIEATLNDNTSEWRVPTRQDWDKLLNSLECEEKKNHDTTSCNKWAGEFAGKFLKSTKYWKGSDFSGIGYENFNILPTGAKWSIDNDDIDGITENAILWTATSETEIDDADIFAKQFAYNNDMVKTISIGPDYFCSLRLVKDFNNNYNPIETICGITTPCSLMLHSGQVWTSANFSLRVDTQNYSESEMWQETFSGETEKIYHFIAEFDGKKWNKRVINEGDGVILTEHLGVKLHDWRLLNGELVDSSQIILGNVATGVEGNILSFNSETGIISANLELKLDGEEIKLINKDNSEALGSVSIAGLSKDGVLETAEITNTDNDGNNGVFLHLKWSDAAKIDEKHIDLSSLFASAQTVGELKKEVEKISGIETNVKDLTTSVNTINDEIEKINIKTAEIEDLKNTLDEISGQIKQINLSLSGITEKIGEINTRIDKISIKGTADKIKVDKEEGKEIWTINISDSLALTQADFQKQ